MLRTSRRAPVSLRLCGLAACCPWLKAPQEALEASKREPRRGQNPPPRGPKGLPGGLREPLGRQVPGGHQGCSETASGRLLGRSCVGVVLGPLGSLPAPPGPLLGVILASRGGSFSAFWVSFSGGFEKIGEPTFLTTIAAKIFVLATPGCPTSSKHG